MHVYHNYNGFLVEDSEKLFTSANRGFKYGDGFFETLRISNNNILFWDRHYERLVKTMEFLNFDVSAMDREFWETQIKKYFVRNNFPDCRLRLTIYRDAGGFYTPDRNKAGFIIEGYILDKSIYEINEKGLKLGLFCDVMKSRQPFSNLKTTNSLPYVLAGIFAEKSGFDDVAILNDADRVSESISSNIFIVEGDKIITPPLTEGCVEGVMRSLIFDLMPPGKVLEETIDVDRMKDADEIFLTNVIRGLQWVGSFSGRQYSANVSSSLVNMLNMAVI
jgi:branched-subunit amino acid aminotransferase/4-amino-4-deoxychorismate lyase